MTVCGHETIGLKFHRCCWCGEQQSKQEGIDEIIKAVDEILKENPIKCKDDCMACFRDKYATFVWNLTHKTNDIRGFQHNK